LAVRLFRFPRHGQSTSTLLELRGTSLVADLECVVAELERRGLQRIFLVGSSMAAGPRMVCPASSERVAGCAFIAPALDFCAAAGTYSRKRPGRMETHRPSPHTQRVARREIGFGVVEEIDLFPLDDLIAHWSTPLVIFHGMRDDVVPIAKVSLSWSEPCFRRSRSGFQVGRPSAGRIQDEMAESACRLFERLIT